MANAWRVLQHVQFMWRQIRYIENAIVRYLVNRFCGFCHFSFFFSRDSCNASVSYYYYYLTSMYVCDEITESTIDYKAEINTHTYDGILS